MVKYFELNRPYNFESGDLTALIYVICTTLGVMGYNITPLFLLGSIIGTVTC